MHKTWAGVILFVLTILTTVVAAQSDLQLRIDRLRPGKTSLDELRQAFGEPNTQTKVITWFTRSRPNSTKKRYFSPSDGTDSNDRAILRVSFDTVGLNFFVFDKPSALYLVEITDPTVSMYGIKLGDHLDRVTQLLGKGRWETTDAQDDFELDYPKLGVRLAFPRDMAARKYPMKLDQRKQVVRIEKYDINISFVGNDAER